jgi:hypothetical protein
MTKRYSGLIFILILVSLSCAHRSTCSQDICKNGFCGSESGYLGCSCELGWTGDYCEQRDVDYFEVECANGFVGIIDNIHVCFCDSGWKGESCGEVIDDYTPCSDVYCNNQGYCLLDHEFLAYCTCYDGYSGDHCENEESACGEEYLLNVASTIYDEDWNAGLDCSFFIGLLWSDMRSNEFTGYPGLCTCLDIFITNMTYWSDNFGCVIEEDFKMSVEKLSHLHCNTCTDDEISDMKVAIQNYSASCDMFITYREEMPLYWRTPLKCVCLNSLGDSREEVGKWVYCPFTDHEARTDLTAYDNCHDESVVVCDFKYVKHAIETNMKYRNPSGFEMCTSAMIDLMEMLPTGGFFKELPDNWCPCYESMAEYWSEGLDVIDCKAVTFYEFTIKDLFVLYCNDMSFQNSYDL